MFQTILKPLARRVGSMLAGALATVVAVSPEQVADLETLVAAILLVAADIAHSNWDDRRKRRVD